MLIGIDVAKAELVVATRPSGARWTVANDEAGIRTLVPPWQPPAPMTAPDSSVVDRPPHPRKHSRPFDGPQEVGEQRAARCRRSTP